MAVTVSKFNGDIVAIWADGTKIGHSVDSTLSVTQDLPDSTTKDSNQFMDHIRGNRSWEVSGSGLVAFDSSMSAIEIIDYILSAATVAIEFKTTNSDDTSWSGNVSVASTSFSVAQNTPGQFDFSMQGNGSLTASVGGYSAEAQAVIDLMTGLVTAEENAINTFVNSQVLSGNWALMDEFNHYGLQTAANALTGWHGLKTQTAILAPTHIPGTGYTFNGTTQYLNTNYSPSVDAVLMTQNDMMFAIDNNATNEANVADILNTFDGTHRIRPFSSQTMNDDTTSTFTTTGPGRYVGVRTSSTARAVWENGISVDATSQITNGVQTRDIIIGAFDNNGTFTRYDDSSARSYAAGAGVGFNVANYDSNLNTLNIALAAV